MYRIALVLSVCISIVFAKENSILLQYTGVDVVHGSGEVIRIMRQKSDKCASVRITFQDIFSGDYAGENVADECKKTFVTSAGRVTPMNVAEGVVTVGELEVLDFIKNKLVKEPDKYLLIDSRRAEWYKKFTIPAAVNLPYSEVGYYEEFPEDFEKMVKMLLIKKYDGKLDFSNAKTLLMFCNGPWCGQSSYSIKELLKIGYPAEKLMWYRGGIQSWLMLGFNIIKPK